MGVTELLVVLLVAVLVIKPKQLPQLIKQAAKLFNGAKKLQETAQERLDAELKLDLLEKNKKKAAAADEQYQQKHDR
jgi:Tat protein translocase TatB subunit